jgi:endonuclease/exonuclease/phosphatase family metal-dependent hydrolase
MSHGVHRLYIRAFDGNATPFYVASASVKAENPGTYQGSYTQNQGGAPRSDGDSATRFNGGGYVDVFNSDLHKISRGTIEAWVKTTNPGSGLRGIVTKQGAYGLFLLDGTVAGYDWNSGAARGTGVNVADGDWHHVALTFRTGWMLIYVDGTLRGTYFGFAALHQNYGVSIGSGGPGVGLQQTLNGTIDDVAIYGEVLTAAEISQLYGMQTHDWQVVFDNAPPTLDQPSDIPSAHTWFSAAATFTATFNGRDRISGVKRFQLLSPRDTGGQTEQKWEDSACSDAIENLCQIDPPQQVLTYSASTMPDGTNTVRAVARDAAGSESERSWPVKVDRSIPSRVDLTGELPNDANHVVGKHTHGMTISADDGFSGVEKLRYEVTPANEPNNIVEQDSSSNDDCTASGCPGTFSDDFTVDTSAFAAGDYVLTAFAEDQVGLSRTTTLQFTVDPNVLSAEQALMQVEAGFPDVVAASTTVDEEGETLAPAMSSESVGGQFATTGSLSASSIGASYASGFSVGEDLATVGVTPSSVGIDATGPLVAHGSAVVYANGEYATDAVVRPTGNGIETFLHIRTAAAPQSMSWHVSLLPDQELRTLTDGNVAVVEDEPLGTTETTVLDETGLETGTEPEEGDQDPPNLVTDTNPDAVDPPADEPLDMDEPLVTAIDPNDIPVTQLAEGPGVNDTASQLNRETRAHADAQQEVTDSKTVRAVFLAPIARDANGDSVPVTMIALGTTLTITVLHGTGAFAYPIMVDPETSAGEDDGGEGEEIEAARSNSFKIMTWNIEGNQDRTGDKKGDPSRKPVGDLAGVISGQKVAVVMLQEVCGPAQFRALRTALRKRKRRVNSYWVPEKQNDGTLHPCAEGQKEGVALFARRRYKMRDRSAKIFRKSGGSKDFRRVLQGASLTIGARALRVYNTHLSHVNDDWRRQQIATVGRIASDHNGTTLVGGDWNWNPEKKAFDKLQNLYDLELIGPGGDVCGNPHGTLVGRPDLCLDHVWGDKQNVGREGPADIIEEMQAGDSDHYPVKIRVKYR